MRGFSVFEDIEPPGVITAHNAHMVGDNVENLAHAVTMQLGDQMLIVFGRADFGIERVVVDDVVAVEATWPGAQIWRGVEVGDAERTEVRDYCRRIAKGEMRIQLQAIGRSRNLV